MNYFEIIDDLYLDFPVEEEYLETIFALLQEYGNEKDIVIDGYFKENFKRIGSVQFPEEYFADPDKIRLYCFCAALCDDELFKILKYARSKIPFTPELTREELCSEIIQMGNMGTKF